MIIDSHCHLNGFGCPSSSFLASDISLLSSDIEAYFITMATISSEWQAQVKFSEVCKPVYCALGVHPWYIDSFCIEQLLYLETLALNPNVVAIGEVGLDFSPKYAGNKRLQLEVLEQQLEIAQRIKKPVSLHVRKAHNEMFALLSNVGVSGVVHGLGASQSVSAKYLDLGFKLGVNGVVTRTNARRYHELVTYAGLENLLLETDFPHVRLFGHECSRLSDIFGVVQKISELLDCSFEHVVQQTSLNALMLFNLNERLNGK